MRLTDFPQVARRPESEIAAESRVVTKMKSGKSVAVLAGKKIPTLREAS